MNNFDSYDILEFVYGAESFVNANYINVKKKKLKLKLNFTIIRKKFYFEKNLFLNFFFKSLVVLKFIPMFSK